MTTTPPPADGSRGGGPHTCMGNMLAHTQSRQIFLRSDVVHAVRTMPCSIGG
jgi:hypothetical protein